MKVAICGCTHGFLNTIYDHIQNHDKETGVKTAFLICTGDFQCLRCPDDMRCLSCPPKYRSMGDFLDYYVGRKVAPVLTLFIGGNHEASNVLQELHYGGWVTENIFFLGYSGVVRVGFQRDGMCPTPEETLRVAGVSGIYNSHHYEKGFFEQYPFDNNSIRSVYHVRRFEIEKLSKVKEALDIVASHDWPLGVERYGDTVSLLRRKPFFAKEVQTNTLGSPPNGFLLSCLQPKYWVASHLHVKFTATVPHSDGHFTRFLALDKPHPGRRQFIDFIEIEPKSHGASNHDSVEGPFLYYDVEWLSILHSTTLQTPIGKATAHFQLREPTEENQNTIRRRLEATRAGSLPLGANPVSAVSSCPASLPSTRLYRLPSYTTDMKDLKVQRVQFLRLLGLENDPLLDELQHYASDSPASWSASHGKRRPLSVTRVVAEQSQQISTDACVEESVAPSSLMSSDQSSTALPNTHHLINVAHRDPPAQTAPISVPPPYSNNGEKRHCPGNGPNTAHANTAVFQPVSSEECDVDIF